MTRRLAVTTILAVIVAAVVTPSRTADVIMSSARSIPHTVAPTT